MTVSSCIFPGAEGQQGQCGDFLRQHTSGIYRGYAMLSKDDGIISYHLATVRAFVRALM